MMYNVQNRRVCWICPSSGILNNEKTQRFGNYLSPSSGEGEEDNYPNGYLEWSHPFIFMHTTFRYGLHITFLSLLQCHSDHAGKFLCPVAYRGHYLKTAVVLPRNSYSWSCLPCGCCLSPFVYITLYSTGFRHLKWNTEAYRLRRQMHLCGSYSK
jgi:hypothetical protein